MDHAGIATQNVVERELRKQKKTRHDFGREKFIEKVWEWRKEKGGIILEQLQRLGASCDWDRTQFTMDPHYSQAVLGVFVDLFKKGHIYRGKRMVNWCPSSLTALSDEEVIMKPVNGTIYRVRYEVIGRAGPVHRGEDDTARDDPRRRGDRRASGRSALHGADRQKGAPPAWSRGGDSHYCRCVGGQGIWLGRAQDHAGARQGRFRDRPTPPASGRRRAQRQRLAQRPRRAGAGGAGSFCRPEKAAELLQASGNLVGEEPYANNVGYSERADVPIEPRLTWQWWLRYPRVEEAKAAVRDGLIKFYPERWSKVYLHWLDNIQDWCISRQLWWGHRIPVWYRKGLNKDESLTEADLKDPAKVHVSLAGPPDPENWVREDDVLDTWFSSWLWPFATMGWPDQSAMAKAGFDYFYPTTTLVTGPDIIFFWVARMIMAGLEFTRPGEPLERRIPFRNVYFTGIIRDQQGRKMSKSLGNSPDPLDLIEKYGADGLRFGIISIAPQGQDIRFQEDRIESGKNFCNKLWNACRFRQMSGEADANVTLPPIVARLDVAKFDADDHAILERLLATTREVDRCFAEFEFSAAVQALYAFFWNDFCDWYVEVSKVKLQSPVTKMNCLAIQDVVLRQTLLLLHPVHSVYHRGAVAVTGLRPPRSFHRGRPPAERLGTREHPLFARRERSIPRRSATVTAMKTFVSQARALKADHNLASRRDVRFFLTTSDGIWTRVQAGLTNFLRMAGAAELVRQDKVEGAPATVTALGTLYLDLASSVDAGAEKIRLRKELDQLAKHIAGTEARLANEAFVSKAPPAVLEGARKQLADQKAKFAELERLLKALG